MREKAPYKLPLYFSAILFHSYLSLGSIRIPHSRLKITTNSHKGFYKNTHLLARLLGAGERHLLPEHLVAPHLPHRLPARGAFAAGGKPGNQQWLSKIQRFFLLDLSVTFPAGIPAPPCSAPAPPPPARICKAWSAASASASAASAFVLALAGE